MRDAPGSLRGPRRHVRRNVRRATAHEPARRARPGAAARHAAGLPPRTFSPPRSLRVRRAGPSLLFRGAAPGAALFRRRHRREAPTVIPRRTLADREDVLGVAMLAPALAYVVLLVGVPFGLAILLSFSNATAGSLSFGWVGGRSHAAILAAPIFLRAPRHTAIVTIGSPAPPVALATAAAHGFRASFPR